MNLALLMRSEVEAALISSDDDPLIIVTLKGAMAEKLSHKYPLDDLTVVAALLDPRFVNLKYINAYVIGKGCTKTEFLANFVKTHIRAADLQVPGSSSQSSSTGTGTQEPAAALALLARKYSDQVSSSADETIKAECQVYLATAPDAGAKIHGDDGLLQFWKAKCTAFPWLAALARKILCVPATSTPSERVFSIAGLLVTSHRTSLGANTCDKVIFVHENYELCKKSANENK